jgi:hypothetical protein
MVEIVKVSKEGYLLKIQEIPDSSKQNPRLWDEDE